MLKGLDLKAVREQLAKFIQFVGVARLRQLYPQYLQGTLFRDTFREFNKFLWGCYEQARDWPQALNDVSGEDTIPIITVHKSKGLEYHTVVFMGLEDSALWNFATQSDEEKRTFFVAFSRAKKRVLFTFCEKRSKGGGPTRPEARKSIGILYDLLEKAGVQPETIA